MTTQAPSAPRPFPVLRRAALLRSQWFLLLLVMLVIAAFTGTVNPRFFRTNNIVNIFEQISTLGVVASGATILMISGNFDISVGANIGLSSCVMAMLIKAGMPYGVAIPAGLLVAVLCGLFVGFNAILFRAPSFIISLAAIGVFRGIALFMTQASLQTIYGKFEGLGSTRFFGVVPLIFAVSLAVYVVVGLILRYTRLGRRVYAIGANEQAAFLSGIAVDLNKIAFFVINGLLVGIAATMLLSRVGAAQPSTGAGIELQAIGAVVIGGTPMTGGKGRILGTFFGVLLMGVISNALNMLQVSPYFQDVTFGMLIIFSVAISAFGKRRGRRAALLR
ncbi:MAG TPA: ABC transporter permease [Anaeromyxobacter sp.]|nr:ABC transporter permease [Anaeromyxobacter sp.]